MERGGTVLASINSNLPDKWEAKLNTTGRLYYLNHQTRSSSWLPPVDNWEGGGKALPYGWELAIDKHGKTYFLNHLEEYSSKNDPREDDDYIEPPTPREISLKRHATLGFGFVAGSEKPVIVRFVTEGGPSEDKLLPGDQIIKINGEEVKKAPREYVIDLVRSCKETIDLTVCQPYVDNSQRKSALLTAAKKAKLQKNPSRVRFAENVAVTTATSPSTHESYIPFMPNVLKVFLENGQTKSFKYDKQTTVKDVLNSLQEKLGLRCMQYFSLVLQNTKSVSHNKFAFLQNDDCIADIACRPGSQFFKCLLRVCFVPRDAYDLLRKDATAFEYFYMQCCNDIVEERFSGEVKFDMALRLAALHMQEHALNNHMAGKILVKNIEKEFGYSKFVPRSLMEHMKIRELRKMLNHYLKASQCLTAPGQKHLTSLQAKLHYLKIISELKSFGAKCFMATLVQKKTEAMIFVGPKKGIAEVTHIKNNTLVTLAEFQDLACMMVVRENDTMQRVDIKRVNPDAQIVSLSMLNDDVHDFVAMVEGYYMVYGEPGRTLIRGEQPLDTEHTDVPFYSGEHYVEPAAWSYPTDLVSETLTVCPHPGTRHADFSTGPPSYVNPDSNQNGDESCDDHVVDHVIKKDADDTLEDDLSNTPKLPSPEDEDYTLFNANARKPSDSDDYEALISNIDKTDSDNDDASVASDSFSTFRNPDKESPLSPHLIKRHKDSVKLYHHSGRPSIDFVNAAFKEHDDVTEEAPEEPSERPLETSDEECEASEQSQPLLQSQDSLAMLVPPGEDEKASGPIMQHHPERPRSVGIASRDTLRKEDLQNSFGLHSPDPDIFPVNKFHPTYNPKIFGDRGLYLDPDIIDLTMIPPPKTPECEHLIDFSSVVTEAPPGFSDGGNRSSQGVPSQSHVVHMSLIDIPAPEDEVDLPPPIQSFDTHFTASEDHDSESDSGNETISSELIELLTSSMSEYANNAQLPTTPIDAANIEAIIATLTVPPPPIEIDDVTETCMTSHDDDITEKGVTPYNLKTVSVTQQLFLLDGATETESSDQLSPKMISNDSPSSQENTSQPQMPNPQALSSHPQSTETFTPPPPQLDDSVLTLTPPSVEAEYDALLESHLNADWIQNGCNVDPEIDGFVIPPPPDSVDNDIDIQIVPPVFQDALYNEHIIPDMYKVMNNKAFPGGTEKRSSSNQGNPFLSTNGDSSKKKGPPVLPKSSKVTQMLRRSSEDSTSTIGGSSSTPTSSTEGSVSLQSSSSTLASQHSLPVGQSSGKPPPPARSLSLPSSPLKSKRMPPTPPPRRSSVTNVTAHKVSPSILTRMNNFTQPVSPIINRHITSSEDSSVDGESDTGSFTLPSIDSYPHSQNGILPHHNGDVKIHDDRMLNAKSDVQETANGIKNANTEVQSAKNGISYDNEKPTGEIHTAENDQHSSIHQKYPRASNHQGLTNRITGNNNRGPIENNVNQIRSNVNKTPASVENDKIPSKYFLIKDVEVIPLEKPKESTDSKMQNQTARTPGTQSSVTLCDTMTSQHDETSHKYGSNKYLSSELSSDSQKHNLDNSSQFTSDVSKNTHVSKNISNLSKNTSDTSKNTS
ncbi:unnamed protein product, partial [Owenia fusiformis]